MVPIREPKRYSILLADDLALVREGLAALCDTQPHLKVVGQCSEGAVALRIIESERPDIAVLDLNLTDLFTLEIVKRVREANIATRIVVLSTRKDRKTVVEALRSGVNAFLLKSCPSNQLLEAFDQILAGGIYVSPQLELDKIFAASGKAAPEDPIEALSAREYQVFTLLIDGIRRTGEVRHSEGLDLRSLGLRRYPLPQRCIHGRGCAINRASVLPLPRGEV
jgi:DNA-binding NarL/FixJ family response regulator